MAEIVGHEAETPAARYPSAFAMARIPVNDPCPCGSGKKYKKCCRDEQTLAARVRANLEEAALRPVQARQAQFDARRRDVAGFGHIRPVVHADFKGQKFIAVAGKLYASPNWKTMVDFLLDYPKMLLGQDWWRSEVDKDEREAHPVLTVARRAYEFMTANGEDAGDLSVVTPDSATYEYLALAYDLYVLRNHGAIQGSLLKRLRKDSQFKGARHEIFAAATMVRANCELTFFNEKKSEAKRPEFVARHRVLGEAVAVEAKARHRPEREANDDGFGVARLLHDAFEKETSGQPLVVFLDLDLAPHDSVGMQQFMPRMHGDIERAKGTASAPDPYAMIVATNHRVKPGSAPDYSDYAVVPIASAHPITSSFHDAIRLAVSQRRNIPSQFEVAALGATGSSK